MGINILAWFTMLHENGFIIIIIEAIFLTKNSEVHERIKPPLVENTTPALKIIRITNGLVLLMDL